MHCIGPKFDSIELSFNKDYSLFVVLWLLLYEYVPNKEV